MPSVRKSVRNGKTRVETRQREREREKNKKQSDVPISDWLLCCAARRKTWYR